MVAVAIGIALGLAAMVLRPAAETKMFAPSTRFFSLDEPVDRPALRH
jgi:hypothetical protein